jgi:Cys-rich four helix bundle protein (predicted Tat secretion target)
MRERRAFLQQVGVTIGTVTARSMAMPASPAPAGAALFADAQRATAECVRAGEACIAHCATELAAGNTQMGKCNIASHDMLALCRATLSLASAESALAKRLALVCADGCRVCAQACLEHKEHWAHGMHLACKVCYESCLACEKACRALAA